MTRLELHGPGLRRHRRAAERRGLPLGSSADADKDAWRIWQANNLDSDSDMAWLEALICKVLVLPRRPEPEGRAETPHIWVEHASQAIVEHSPAPTAGTARRR
jgi:hypothetical protein